MSRICPICLKERDIFIQAGFCNNCYLHAIRVSLGTAQKNERDRELENEYFNQGPDAGGMGRRSYIDIQQNSDGLAPQDV
jgi:hypothetical protein